MSTGDMIRPTLMGRDSYEVHVNSDQGERALVARIRGIRGSSDRETLGLANYVGEVLGQCEPCRAFDMATHIAISGATTGPAFRGKLQTGLLFLSDPIALRAAYVYPKYSLAILPSRFMRCLLQPADCFSC